MFGSRFIVNMACKSMYRSTFKVSQSFATMTPIYTYKINKIKRDYNNVGKSDKHSK